jgi:hypothetical protein
MIGGRLKDKPPDPQHDGGVGADLRAAYERGRRDERAARRRHPMLMTLTVLTAVVGLVLLALAAINGSFGRAGGVVDEQIAAAADQAGPKVRAAADNAGQELHDATRSARSDAPG